MAKLTSIIYLYASPKNILLFISINFAELLIYIAY